MYRVNYLVPTANGNTTIHEIIVSAMKEVKNIKNKCKELNYRYLSCESEKTYHVEFRHNGYDYVRIIKCFNAEEARNDVYRTLNKIVDCNVVEVIK